jgi:hydroxylamine reductase
MFSLAAVRSLRLSGGTVAGRASRRLVAPAIKNPKAALFLPTTRTMMRSFSTNPQEMKPPPTDMFCRQCEQTQSHVGCTTTGVCGKTSETAAVQDALVEQVKAVSLWAVAARQSGIAVPEVINAWTLQAAFSTLTNVNFSPDRICDYIRQGVQHQQTLQGLVGTTKEIPEDGLLVASMDLSGMSDADLETFGHTVGILKRQEQMGNPDCFSLNEIGTYGLKGGYQAK